MSGTGPSSQRPHGVRIVADEDGPGKRVLDAMKRFWHSDDPKLALARDLGVSILGIIIVLIGLWGYTGQPFPGTSPMVVVESGSMMHPDAPYGRAGTIDAGDLILVKTVDDARELGTAYAPDERTGYGGHGEVIIFLKDGNPDSTPIIHRALTWVEVYEVPSNDPTVAGDWAYDYHDERGALLRGQRAVDLPGIGLINWEPTIKESGFVTRGDNPATNSIADQKSLVRDKLIQPDWIVGVARGEIPWVGLLKLAVTGNQPPTVSEDMCLVAAAWAPCDAWTMLGVSIGTVIVVPLTLEAASRMRRSKEDPGGHA